MRRLDAKRPDLKGSGSDGHMAATVDVGVCRKSSAAGQGCAWDGPHEQQVVQKRALFEGKIKGGCL